MNPNLNGSWSYRSFRHDPIILKEGMVVGDPELAVPWSPCGRLEVTTSAEGLVSGTLTFPQGIALSVRGAIVPATDKQPASVILTGEGRGSVNRIKGFFIPQSDHVVGTILCTDNDLLGRPNGTLGPFVLVPLKPQI